MFPLASSFLGTVTSPPVGVLVLPEAVPIARLFVSGLTLLGHLAPSQGATRTKTSSNEHVHINGLEFIVVILQLAAVLTRLENCDAGISDPAVHFPAGIPDIPVWLVESDNVVSVVWE